MKALSVILIVLSIAGMVMLSTGCMKSLTKAYYGSDLTPDQVRDEVWGDGYAIASVRVKVASVRLEKDLVNNKAGAEAIKEAKIKLCDDILGRIKIVKGSTDPMSEINQYWYNLMAQENNEQRLLILTGAGMLGRRLLSRVNVNVIEDELGKQFDARGIDLPLFLHGVDGYEKSILDFKKTLE